MRILVVTPACHFPSKGATQQDIYAFVDLLIKMGHHVALYTLDQPGQDQSVLDALSTGYKIEVKKFLPSKSLLWLRSALLNWLYFDRSVFVFEQLVSNKDFQFYTANFAPEVIVANFTYSWPLVKIAKKQRAKLVIRSHNFEPLHFWEELAGCQKLNPFNVVRFFLKLLNEKKAISVADVVASISPDEVKRYEQWGQKKIILLPLVSLHQFSPRQNEPVDKDILDLFYLGATYNVPFHLRGAKILIEKIAPAVLAKAPEKFRFHICGSKLPQFLIAKCDNQNIIYEGFVKNLDEFFEKMDAGVFPVWSGRGMKQKIFEAVARAFPVVVPKVALGGYNLVNGRDALLAGSKRVFISQILRMADKNLRDHLSLGARNFSQLEFSQEGFKDILNSIIKL